MMLSSTYRLGSRGQVLSMFTRTMATVSRRPVRIVNIEKLEDGPNNIMKESPLEGVEANVSKRGRKGGLSSKDLGNLETTADETVDATGEEVIFQDKRLYPPIKEESNDYHLSKFMLVVKSRARRRKVGITLLEGKRLITDALNAGVKLQSIFFSRRSDLAEIPLPPYGYHLHWLPYRFIQKWSDTTTPAGLLGIVEIPDAQRTAPDPNSIPLTVVCDNIRDPGNMGAILRVLAGVGCQRILITKGCVDIWEPKVLRAGCGGHFRIPISYDLKWDDIISIIENDASVFLADITKTKDPTSISDSEINSDSDQDTDSEDNADDSIEQKTSNSDKNVQNVLTSLPYYGMNFKTNGHNVLIISNEATGPSNRALAFVSKKQGVKIHIPLYGKVESLNVVAALSVIAFEMRRQAVAP